jgi:hypothetical protein
METPEFLSAFAPLVGKYVTIKKVKYGNEDPTWDGSSTTFETIYAGEGASGLVVSVQEGTYNNGPDDFNVTLYFDNGTQYVLNGLHFAQRHYVFRIDR